MEPKTIIVDSSFLVALYLTNDSQHAVAVAMVRRLTGIEKTLVLHPYVIQEVATILAYRVGVSLATRFLDDMMASKQVLISAISIGSEIEFFKRVGRKMSFADIAIVRLAEQMNAPVLTFDRQILSLLRDITI